MITEKGRLQNEPINYLERLQAFSKLILTDNEEDFVKAYSFLTGRHNNGHYIYSKIESRYEKNRKQKRSGK